MTSLIPLAGPVACAGLMGGMMWWMMRGKRGTGGDRADARDADPQRQVARLQEENAELRAHIDTLGPR